MSIELDEEDDWLIDINCGTQKKIPSNPDDIENECRIEAEKVFRYSAIKFITENVKEYDLSSTYVKSECDIDVKSLAKDLYTISPISYCIEPVRDCVTGEVIDFKEVLCNFLVESDAKSSLSINRKPDANAMENVTGSLNNLPFMPGGFDENFDNILNLKDLVAVSDVQEKEFLNFDNLANDELLTCAPGLPNGVISIDDVDSRKKLDSSQAEYFSHFTANEMAGPNFDLEGADIFDLIDFVAGNDLVLPIQEETGAEIKIDESTNDKNLDTSIEENVDSSNELEDIPLFEVFDLEVNTNRDKRENQNRKYNFAELLNTSRNIEEYENSKNKMVKKYPFSLDPFQQQAILCMEKGQSVFVAAHTSAGKTVVAEYAIALCAAHKTRAIYTSPIKALSNQKFRDLRMIFGDVGLITGDIQLNRDAFTIVMTTEVLRSMLYCGAEIIRELEWVIFDEVHYINDNRRGYVWEEVFIMLPAHVKIVMLSATVPNYLEFADWVGRIKNRKVYVIATTHRPVPLEHYIYTGQDGKTRKDLFKIVDSSGELLTRKYADATAAKTKLSKQKDVFDNRPVNKLDKNIYLNLLKYLAMENLLPVVVFVFSRRRCDENAMLLQSLDLTTLKQKSEIHRFFQQCVNRLKGSDKKLPQVLQMVEHCKRGFAVHHSGILPILKEVVELLFQKGLVKVLFATETFAMGVNMPARTVVFDSLTKHDGAFTRSLHAGEYTQMAGRAGRRGLDDTGTVVVICKGQSLPGLNELTSLMLGQPTKLESRFRITYSMLLNLLRVEFLRVEDMLQRSYSESDSLRLVVTRRKRLKEVETDLKLMPPLNCSLCFPDIKKKNCSTIRDYFLSLLGFVRVRADLWQNLAVYNALDKLISCGRLIIVALPEIERLAMLAVVLKVNRNNFTFQLMITINNDEEGEEIERKQRFFDKLSDKEKIRLLEKSLLLNAALNFELIDPATQSTTNSTYHVIDNVPISNLIAVCQQTLKVDYSAILEHMRMKIQRRSKVEEPEPSVMKTVFQLNEFVAKFSRGESGAKIIGFRDFPVGDLAMVDKILKTCELKKSLEDNNVFPCRLCTYLHEHLLCVGEVYRLEDERDQLQNSLSFNGLLFSAEYEARLNVLRKLSYIDSTNIVTLKGRVACELHQKEIIVSELLLDNKFQKRTIPEIAALLSTTFEGKSNVDAKYGDIPVLFELQQEVMEVMLRITNAEQEFGVPSCAGNGEDVRFDLMHVAYEWASGTPFARIMEMTSEQEGIIVRCIQRLDELCKNVRNAARLVGDLTLYETMENVSLAIKRDIVFAASLYTVVDS